MKTTFCFLSIIFISVFSAFGEKIEAPLTPALAPRASIRENTVFCFYLSCMLHHHFCQVFLWSGPKLLSSTLFLKRNTTYWKLPFFWRRVYTSESGVISHDPGSHDPDPGPQEKSTKKSCVSFETECIYKAYKAFMTHVYNTALKQPFVCTCHGD